MDDTRQLWMEWCMLNSQKLLTKHLGTLPTISFKESWWLEQDLFRIDVVFDDYHKLSIKNVERSRRSKGSHLLFKSVISSSELKQWVMFLSSNENKSGLVRFIVAEWKRENHRLTIGSKSIFVTDGEKDFKINEDTVIAIPELEGNHEKADTRMMSHAQHTSQHIQKILISSPETDVFIIFYHFNLSSMQIYIFSQG